MGFTITTPVLIQLLEFWWDKNSERTILCCLHNEIEFTSNHTGVDRPCNNFATFKITQHYFFHASTNEKFSTVFQGHHSLTVGEKRVTQTPWHGALGMKSDQLLQFFEPNNLGNGRLSVGCNLQTENELIRKQETVKEDNTTLWVQGSSLLFEAHISLAISAGVQRSVWLETSEVTSLVCAGYLPSVCPCDIQVHTVPIPPKAQLPCGIAYCSALKGIAQQTDKATPIHSPILFAPFSSGLVHQVERVDVARLLRRVAFTLVHNEPINGNQGSCQK